MAIGSTPLMGVYKIIIITLMISDQNKMGLYRLGHSPWPLDRESYDHNCPDFDLQNRIIISLLPRTRE